MNRMACCALGKWESASEALVVQLLQSVRPAVQHLLVVLDENAPETARAAISSAADQVLVKSCEWDGQAYRAAMEAIGWDQLADADELILFSGQSIASGSVEYFLDRMSAAPGDFWQVTDMEQRDLHRHFALFGVDYLMGLRKALLRSPALRTIMETVLPRLTQTEYALEREFWLGHELEKAGFVPNTLLENPAQALYRFDQLLIHADVPLIPAKAFLPDTPENWYTHSDGQQFARLLAHLRSHHNWDERPFWKRILSCTTFSQLKSRFHLLRIIQPQKAPAPHTALLMYVPSEWHLGILEPYMQQAAAQGMAVALFYTDSALRSALKAAAPQAQLMHVENHSGRLPHACLAAARELLRSTQAVCCMLHWPEQGPDGDLAREQYLRAQMELLLGSSAWAMERFAAEPALGLIQPEVALTAHFFALAPALMRGPMIDCFSRTHKELALTLPFDDALELPTLTCWMRSQALLDVLNALRPAISRKITAMEYQFDYFLRRFMQLEGYYPLYISTPEAAQAELAFQSDSLRVLNESIAAQFGCHFYRSGVLSALFHAQAAAEKELVLGGRAILAQLRAFIKRKARGLLSIPEGDSIKLLPALPLKARLEACEAVGSRVRILVSSDDVQLDETWFSASFRRYRPLYTVDADAMKAACTNTAASMAVYEVPGSMLRDGVSLIWENGGRISLAAAGSTPMLDIRKNKVHLAANASLPAPAVAAPRRLGIFFFFDADGVVDDYVVYYLEQFRTVAQENCVVVNGKLTEEGRARLEAVCNRLIVRENTGFDSGAYKAAVLDYGYEAIARDYDEVVLHNFTDYGPLYPFHEMMDEMTARDNDFWGHCRYVVTSGEKLEGHPLRDHLMSYFLVFKKPILTSPAFREYWQTLQTPSNYVEAVLFHEMRCTGFFEDRGFVSDSFMPEERYHQYGNSIVFVPFAQLKEHRSPLLKRKVFFVKDGCFAFQRHASEPDIYDLLAYVRDHTDYDPMLVYENIMRTQKPDAQKLVFREELTLFSAMKFLNSCKEMEM